MFPVPFLCVSNRLEREQEAFFSRRHMWNDMIPYQVA